MTEDYQDQEDHDSLEEMSKYRRHSIDKAQLIETHMDRISYQIARIGLKSVTMEAVKGLMVSISALEALLLPQIDMEYREEIERLEYIYNHTYPEEFPNYIPERYPVPLINWYGDPYSAGEEYKMLTFSIVKFGMLRQLMERAKARSKITTVVRCGESNYILDKAKERLWKFNQNWIAVCVGGPGSGKSFDAIQIADYMMGWKFRMDLLFLEIKDFLAAVKEKRIQKGDIVILDEAGVQFGARSAMTRDNRQVSHLFQVMRYMNFGLILTVPSTIMVDKHGRDLVHMRFKTLNINRKEEYVDTKVEVMEFNPYGKDAYPKMPRIPSEGMQKEADQMHIYKPRQELVEAYEAKKKAFGDTLAEKAMKVKEKKVRQGKSVTCDKCGYEWIYTGRLKEPTCPGCRRQTKTK